MQGELDTRRVPRVVSPYAPVGRMAGYGRAARLSRHTEPVTQAGAVNWIIRCAFYVFIFALPFEAVYVGAAGSLARLIGLALAGVTLSQPELCYRRPPGAFWCFASYILVFACAGGYMVLDPPHVPDFFRSVVGQFVTLAQLLVLFWLSYNLLSEKRVWNGALWAFAMATMLLAFLQLAGITSDVSSTGRVAAFEGNPNVLATVLSLGLLALFGLAYGQEKSDWRERVTLWMGSGVLILAMVQTGSRGTLAALVVSVALFSLRGKTLATKLKVGAIAIACIIAAGVASYQIEEVRLRWEKTLYDEDLAGRKEIYMQTVDMISERPLMGWGPIFHLWELGPRVGQPYRDEHNVYLWILAEVGLVGAIPFFAGLWLCWRSAWGSRNGRRGILPAVLLLFLLAVSMKGTLHKEKYFWLVLSIALAASSSGSPRSRPSGVLVERRPRSRTVSVRSQGPSAIVS